MIEIPRLIAALREKVCGGEGIAYGELTDGELKALYSLAKSQDLAHIAAAALKDVLAERDPQIKKAFEQARLLASYRYVNINSELRQICTALEEKGIRYMPLKGSIIRSYYPSPEMRTSCDIDILVPVEDVDAAADYLVSELDYTFERRCSHDVSLYSPSKVHLELHFDLIEDNERVAAVLADIWDRASVDGCRYNMTNEHFTVYHIAHMAEHYVHGGCGVRNFLDLYIAKHKMGYDEAAVEKMLADCGLDKFAAAAFKLADIWFSQGEHDELTLEMQDYVMQAGVYGNLENNIAVAQGNKSGIGYALSRIFMPYAKLKRYYPVLDKYPILFPFYQVVRWVEFIFRKDKSRAFAELKHSGNVDREKQMRLKSMMDELKLI